MKIEQDNITIRSAERQDAIRLNTWWNDGRVMAHAGFPNGLGESMEETLACIEWWNNGSIIARTDVSEKLGKSSEEVIDSTDGDNKNSHQLCIIEIDGIPVGELNYKIRSEEATAYPGWKICETDFQNKGYGPKIIIMLFDFLFTDKKINSHHKLERIVWDTMLGNRRAQHVYENKIGAKKTKIVEHAWQDQTGAWRTAVYYEITRETFYELHT